MGSRPAVATAPASSAAVTPAPAVIQPPPVPANVQAGTPTTNSVTISWNSAGSGISYKIYYQAVNDSSRAILYGNPVTGTSINITGLTSGINYYFWVTSLQNNLESAKSSVVSVRTAMVRESSEAGLTIGIVLFNDNNGYFRPLKEAIESKAARKANLTMVDAGNYMTVQNSQVEKLIADGMNVIAINPIDVRNNETIISWINKAKDANIPLVFFDRQISDTYVNLWERVYYIGADNKDAGIRQGEIIVDWWNSAQKVDRNRNGTLDYIMFTGPMDHEHAQLRTKYSVETVKNAGINVNEFAQRSAGWSDAQAKAAMEILWSAHGTNVDVIFCNNDGMAFGVINYLKENKIPKNRWPVIVGVDCTSEAVQAIKAGDLFGTVYQSSANHGTAIFDFAYALALGNNPATQIPGNRNGRFFFVNFVKVTKDNIHNF